MTANEPVVAGVSLIGFAQAVIAVLTAFGLGLTHGQVAALEGLVVILAPVVAFLVRSHVTPNAKLPAPAPPAVPPTPVTPPVA